MRTEIIARPYARALFESATERGDTPTVAQDLAHVMQSWQESPDLRVFLARPEVPATAKKTVLERLFHDRLSPLTRHLLAVVVDKHRVGMLPEISREFVRLWDGARGILHADVDTAAPLTDQEQADLKRAIAQATGHQVELRVRVNALLLGGVVIRVGDRVLDGSLARRLEILGERLRSGDRGGNAVEY
ncbi:MAG: ATP synthase F1 subunit delta [Thermaerobacter sp.]|nr:ATP synthase F1 subunit delta [Thermaerobacter sp.]